MQKVKLISCIAAIVAAVLSFAVVATVFAVDAVFVAAEDNSLDSTVLVDTAEPLKVISDLDEKYGTNNAEYEYRLDKVLQVSYGNVYKFMQMHNGVRVSGGDFVVCTDGDNAVVSVFGGAVDIEKDGDGASSAIPSVVVSVPQKDALGNVVEVNVENYAEYSYSLYDATRNIYMIDYTTPQNPTYYFNTTGVFEPIAVSAYANVVKAYDFYTDPNNIGVALHGVDNGNDDIDGNYADNDEVRVLVYMHYGDKYENANCDYYADADDRYVMMLVGDGNPEGYIYQPAVSSDIIGHEYQHAVSGYVAGFEYLNDSGALNEAISDIFGALIEGYEPSDERFWTIGENSAIKNGAVRSIKGGTPNYKYDIADKIPGCKLDHDHKECRYGGTHFNSTIISHIQYELYRQMPEFFSRERIGELWYSTLCTLTEKSDFSDFGLRFYRTAQNLGYEKDVCNAIYDCLNERGLLPFHTVTFTDYDGSVLRTVKTLDRDDAAYSEPPTRQSDIVYDYEFSGWSAPINNVVGDITVRAEYKKSLRSYSVVFWDVAATDKPLFEYDLEYGSFVGLPDMSKLPEKYKGYRFDGWFTDKELTMPLEDAAMVDGDMVLYGKFTEVKKKDNTLIIVLSTVGGVVAIALCVIVVWTVRKRGGKRKTSCPNDPNIE